jgi:hypothetical protein
MISEHHRARLAAGAAGLVLATLAAAARAEEPADEHAPPSTEIADAVAEYDAGHFEEARALFRRAHAQAPSARTLRGIGMASFELRDYVEASRSLAAALEETRHALTPEQRQHVEGLLARAQTFVGRFTLRLEPADATLVVDGQPASREADGTLLLPFGRHVVGGRCPSCAPLERAIEVLGGERQAIELVLAPQASVRSAPGADPPPLRIEASGARSPAVYWFGGAALVSAAGAVAAGLWWHDRAGELDTCNAAGTDCKNQPTIARQSHLATGTTLALGAVALTTGVIAAALWPHHEPAHTVACAPAPQGITCALPF